MAAKTPAPVQTDKPVLTPSSLDSSLNSPISALSGLARPWPQLVLGVLCMVMIANLQYGWTFFVPSIQQKFGWEHAEIQMAFTIFVLFETWLVPIEGWFVDKFGPRAVVLFGGVLCALGWTINSQASTLGGFYTGQVFAGIGAGAVYGTCIGNALKWFTGRRGLAAGITAAGFGAGSALAVVPIQNMIKDGGFQQAFLYFGLGQGLVICLLASVMMAPRANQMVAAAVNSSQSRSNFTPNQIIGSNRTWIKIAAAALIGSLVMFGIGLQFYIPLALALLIFIVGGATVWRTGQPIFTLMYAMFVLVGAGGLIVTANLAPIAKDLHVAGVQVSFMWLTLPALTFAATLDRILNGLTRPFFGWISDHIGRENTMFIAFSFEGAGIYAIYLLGSDPVWFVILSGMVFFAWGEIYSLFPATCTDIFGTKFSSTNSGLLYTAKGTAALLVPYASSVQKFTGSWDLVFLIAAGANVVAAILAIAVLKPWRQSVVASANHQSLSVVEQALPATTATEAIDTAMASGKVKS